MINTQTEKVHGYVNREKAPVADPQWMKLCRVGTKRSLENFTNFCEKIETGIFYTLIVAFPIGATYELYRVLTNSQ